MPGPGLAQSTCGQPLHSARGSRGGPQVCWSRCKCRADVQEKEGNGRELGISGSQSASFNPCP